MLAEALSDPLATLFFWLPASETYADASGELVAELPRRRARARPRSSARERARRVLLHDPGLLERRDLLRGVLAAAALSIEIARLRVEVRFQLAEVEASRARIVEAGYEERRRLERDLHDGAQQRLVSLGVQIRRLQRTLPREASILSPALDQIVGEVGAAIADLRQIAAGVRPGAARRRACRRAPRSRELVARPGRGRRPKRSASPRASRRRPTSSRARRSRTRSSTRPPRRSRFAPSARTATLLLTVSDDGIGGAVARRGSGLAGLEDRVAAHGGTLEIVSPQRRRHADRGGDPVRLVIAEDTALLREGLAGLLEDAGHTVLARVGDAESLLAVVAEHEPELAIVDVRMPPTYEDEGMRAAVEIRRLHPETAVLVLSQHVESRYAVELVGLGRRLRLPPQGPRPRRRRVPRGGRPGLQRWLGARPRGGEAAPPAAAGRRRAGRAHAARARGARADGGGQDECGHRPAALADGEDRRDPRQLDPRQSSACRSTATRTAACWRSSPISAGARPHSQNVHNRYG